MLEYYLDLKKGNSVTSNNIMKYVSWNKSETERKVLHDMWNLFKVKLIEAENQTAVDRGWRIEETGNVERVQILLIRWISSGGLMYRIVTVVNIVLFTQNLLRQ